MGNLEAPKWAEHFKVESAKDFIDRDIVHRPDLIEGMLSNKSIHFIHGLGKLGKSFFITQMAICLDLGIPFLGRGVPETKSVLIIQMEISENCYQDRLKRMFDYVGREPKRLSIANCRNFKLHTKEEREYFSKMMVNEIIPKFTPEVVMFDPISKLHFYNENSSQDMSYFMSIFDNLLVDCGLDGIVCVHHETKNQFQINATLEAHKMRGSTVLFDFSDSATGLKYTNARGILRMIHEDRDHERFEMRIARDPSMFWYHPVGEKPAIAPVKIREIVKEYGCDIPQKDLI